MHASRLQRQYSFAPHNIVPMDETAVWNNMVPEITVEATGAKDVPIKIYWKWKSPCFCLFNSS